MFSVAQRLRPIKAPKQDMATSAAYNPARAPDESPRDSACRLASPKQSEPKNRTSTARPPNSSPHSNGAHPARREQTKPPHKTVSPRTESPSGVMRESGSGMAQTVPAAISRNMSPATAATGIANSALPNAVRRLPDPSAVRSSPARSVRRTAGRAGGRAERAAARRLSRRRRRRQQPKDCKKLKYPIL